MGVGHMLQGVTNLCHFSENFVIQCLWSGLVLVKRQMFSDNTVWLTKKNQFSTCLLFPRQSWWIWISKVQTLISCSGVSLMLLLKPALSELINKRCPAPEFTSYFKELNFWSPELPCLFSLMGLKWKSTKISLG